jgi:CRISPR-associated endonuclease/helicase Cas3
LLDVEQERECQQLGPGMRDLVLHLIAAHHGRARPHFPVDPTSDPPIDETFDPESDSRMAAAVAIETPRRFARLQRQYGRWGLAYLESLLRAADYAASAKPSEFVERQEGQLQ